MKKILSVFGIVALAATALYITYYLVNNNLDDRSSADAGNGYWGCFNEGEVNTKACTKTSEDKNGRRVTKKGTRTGRCIKITTGMSNDYRLDWTWGACN
ncbi:MAG: hypothetical protein WAV40_01470 [Microgenomates group bacterium]